MASTPRGSGSTPRGPRGRAASKKTERGHVLFGRPENGWRSETAVPAGIVTAEGSVQSVGSSTATVNARGAIQRSAKGWVEGYRPIVKVTNATTKKKAETHARVESYLNRTENMEKSRKKQYSRSWRNEVYHEDYLLPSDGMLMDGSPKPKPRPPTSSDPRMERLSSRVRRVVSAKPMVSFQGQEEESEPDSFQDSESSDMPSKADVIRIEADSMDTPRGDTPVTIANVTESTKVAGSTRSGLWSRLAVSTEHTDKKTEEKVLGLELSIDFSSSKRGSVATKISSSGQVTGEAQRGLDEEAKAVGKVEDKFFTRVKTLSRGVSTTKTAREAMLKYGAVTDKNPSEQKLDVAPHLDALSVNQVPVTLSITPDNSEGFNDEERNLLGLPGYIQSPRQRAASAPRTNQTMRRRRSQMIGVITCEEDLKKYHPDAIERKAHEKAYLDPKEVEGNVNIRMYMSRQLQLLPRKETFVRKHERLDVRVPKEHELRKGRELFDVSSDEEQDPFIDFCEWKPKPKTLFKRNAFKVGGNMDMSTVIAGAKMMKKVKQHRLKRKNFANLVLGIEGAPVWKPVESKKAKAATEFLWGKLKDDHKYEAGESMTARLRSDNNVFTALTGIVRQDRSFWNMKGPCHIKKITPPVGCMGGGTRVEIEGDGFDSDDLVVIFHPPKRVWESNEQCHYMHPLYGRDVRRVGNNRILLQTPWPQHTCTYGVQVIVTDSDGQKKQSFVNKKTQFRFGPPIIMKVVPKQCYTNTRVKLTIWGLAVGRIMDEPGYKMMLGPYECELKEIVVETKKVVVLTEEIPDDGVFHLQLRRITEVGVPVFSEIRPGITDVTLVHEEKVEVNRDMKKIKVDTSKTRIEIDIKDLFKRSEDPHQEMRDVCAYLSEHLHELKQIFYYYAMEAGTAGQDDPNDMGGRQFQIFIEDSKIAGKGAVGAEYPMASADIIFIRANREWEDDDDNDNSALVLHEFLGAVVRLAHGKYHKEGLVLHRLRKLYDDHLAVHTKKILDQSFFLRAMADHDLQDLLADNMKHIELVFNYFSGFDGTSLGGSGTMNWTEFLVLSKECNFKTIPELELRNAFAKTNIGEWVEMPVDHRCDGVCTCPPSKSAITVFDPDAKKKKKAKPADAAEDPTELGLDEFIELMCRVAMIANGMGDDEDENIVGEDIMVEIRPMVASIKEKALKLASLGVAGADDEVDYNELEAYN